MRPIFIAPRPHASHAGAECRLLMLALCPVGPGLLPAGPARAQSGSYGAPQYTGGQITGGHASSDGPYAVDTTGDADSGDYGGLGDCYGLPSPGDSPVTCSGQISAKFTWAGAGPPPTAAIEVQTLNMHWLLLNPQDQDLSCGGSNPLGGAPVSDGQGGRVWDATSYAPASGAGSTVTVTCSPTCTTSAANNISGSEVYYTAALYPVTIQLVGAPATTDGTAAGPPEAMAGEQITAKISYSGPGNIVSYAWSTSGGSPFKTYNTALSSNQQVSLSAADMAAQNFSFYDASSETVTVKCAVVIQPPTPTGGTAPPTVTAMVTSQPVTFVKPTFDAWTINHGYVQKTAGYIMRLAATATVPNGEDWSGVTMTFPASLPSYLVGGMGCFAQLDTPNYTYAPAPANPDPLNGIQGLDTSFPLRDASGHVAEWGLTGTPGSPTTPSPDDGDSPGIGGSNGSTTKIVSSEAFTTWVMYQPVTFTPAGGPAQGVIWVPIANYPWGWGGTATLANNAWSLSSISPASAGTGPSASATSMYPTWSCVHTN